MTFWTSNLWNIFMQLAKKWPKIVKNGHFKSHKFSGFFLPKLKKKNESRKTSVFCCSFWSNWDLDMFSTSSFVTDIHVVCQKKDQKWSYHGHIRNLNFQFFFLPKLILIQGTFSPSKWPSAPKFCERYSGSWQIMAKWKTCAFHFESRSMFNFVQICNQFNFDHPN